MTTVEFEKLAADRPQCSESVMTNYNHTIEPNAEEQLQAGKLGEYTAWNFFAVVLYHDKQYHADIQVYCVSKEVISANTLEEIMTLASEKYGAD